MNRLLLLTTLMITTLGTSLRAEEETGVQVREWDDAALAAFASIPVQDQGRVKPLQTYAHYTLLQLSGRTKAKLPDGTSRNAMSWLLDCLFHPELARGYRVLLVPDAAVLDAIEIDHGTRKKRDRYSYDELAAGSTELNRLAHLYGRIDSKQRDTLQEQVLHLAHNLRTLDGLLHYLDFARERLPVEGDPTLTEIFQGATTVTFSQALGEAARLRRALALGAHAEHSGSAPPPAPERNVLHEIQVLGGAAFALALIPPSASPTAEPEWLTPADVLMRTLRGENLRDQVAILAHLENVTASLHDPSRFASEATGLRDGVHALARVRGEARHVDLEVFYHRSRLVGTSLMLFLGSFLLIALTWLRPKGRFLKTAGIGLLVTATAFLVTAIGIRSVIRGRPPVTTLYETILFVTASAVIVSLILEWFDRGGLATCLAAVLGATGLFLAGRYEISQAKDTMPVLIAVLDTNFWLSTHVTTITLGYGAGLLGSALAHIFLLGKAIGWRAKNASFYRGLARTMYGVVCFGLLLSLIGTILGGIWANESWGRFWGWDPKENGALMIVIANLLVVHGRRGGFLREYGVAFANIGVGLIVAFSWWGVNLLGVGLHSYGFTSGIMLALLIFYGVEGLVLMIGTFAWVRERIPALRHRLSLSPKHSQTKDRRPLPSLGRPSHGARSDPA